MSSILLGLAPGAAAVPLPTTPADYIQPGTQPATSLDNFEHPVSCASFTNCHGSYLDFDHPVSAEEPYDGWVMSLMAHSARDPRMHATLARLEALFDVSYPINHKRPADRGPAMGRYAGDVYYSGGAYFFSHSRYLVMA